MAICICKPNRRSKRCEAHMGFIPKPISRSSKAAVKASGEFVLDYSEFFRAAGRSCYFIGRGRVAGNTSPIPSGLHSTPRQAWRAAEIALGL